MNPPVTATTALWESTDLNQQQQQLPPTSAIAAHSLPPLQSLYAAKNVNMDTESVLSGYSERSGKKVRANGNPVMYDGIVNNGSPGAHILTPQPQPQVNHSLAAVNPYHANYQPSSGQLNTLSGRSVSSRHSHYSTNKNGASLYSPKVESPYDIASRQEVTVQVLAQDSERWADNTTAITGNTSEHSGSFEDLRKFEKENFLMDSFQMRCQMWSGTVIAIVLSICAFLSPILMVILPRIDMFEWKTKECGPECDGLLISFVFKLFILAVGSWAVFVRSPKATMPRVYVYRSVVLGLIVIFMVSYWLFYSVRIAEKRFSEEDAISYYSIILFAISLVDALLFIHYLAVILLEIRHLDSQYFIKVVRSPDGYSQCYNLGNISIQRASVWILEKYYQDFPIYNPYLERIPLRKNRKPSISRNGTSALKYYDVDGLNRQPSTPDTANNNSSSNSMSPKSILAQNTAANAGIRSSRPYMNGGSTISDGRARRERDTASHHSGHSGHNRHHNDRFYEEHEFERRVRKRKTRLVSVTEEAFTHIKRVQHDRSKCRPVVTDSLTNWFPFLSLPAGPSVPMDPKEAAQAIFPTIAKTLQKYLRITRQQPRHTAQSILEHLTTCLSFDLSPRSFLEKYLSNSSVLSNDEEKKSVQTWSLICDTFLSRSIESGTMFLLRQGDVSLLVTVHKLPHFNIAEEVIDPKSSKFVFKLNSETSV